MRDPDSGQPFRCPRAVGGPPLTGMEVWQWQSMEGGDRCSCRWVEGPGPGAARCRRGVGRSSIWPAAACPLEVRAALISTQFPGPWPCLILCFLSSMFNYIVVNE